jgi:hypothetical protein
MRALEFRAFTTHSLIKALYIERHLPMVNKTAYRQWRDSSQQVEAIVADDSLPLWQKAHQVGGAYAGLALSELKPKHQKKIESGFIHINAILADYTLNSFDDYEHMDREDLEEIVRIVRSLAPPRTTG